MKHATYLRMATIGIWLIYSMAIVGCASNEVSDCSRILIVSAGEYSFRTKSIAAIEPGSGGIGGDAWYVAVSKPQPPAAGDFSDVTRITLMADIDHLKAISCQIFDSEPNSMRCTMSMPARKLELTVKFDKAPPKAASWYEERTEAVAKYVNADVLGCSSGE